MNSLFELVVWGAPAFLLSWGLFLVIACVLVFLDDTGDGCSSQSGSINARA